MVLAREESIYIHKQVEENQQNKPNKHKKKIKSYKFEKAIACFGIISILACSILLLTRFMDITESKHRVNTLQRQIGNLETEREKLRVAVETVSRSGLIEGEAVNRLGMEYPKQEQIMHINVNPVKVASIESEIKNNDFIVEKESSAPYRFFSRLAGYIGI